MDRKRVTAAVVAIGGLVATAYASRALAWHVQGFHPGEAVGSPDCDDCVATATLDALPYVALGVLLYAVAVGAAWWVAVRRGR